MANEPNWNKWSAIAGFSQVLVALVAPFATIIISNEMTGSPALHLPIIPPSSPWVFIAAVYSIGLIGAAALHVKAAKINHRDPKFDQPVATQSPHVEIEKRDQQIAQLETDISALHADRRARRINNLETENVTLNADIARLKDELATAQLAQQGHEANISALTGALRSLQEEKNKVIHEKAQLLRKMDAMIDGFVGSDLLGVKGSPGVAGSLDAGKIPFSWTDREVILFEWPEKVYLTISRHSDSGTHGLIIEVGNKTPADIGTFWAAVADAVTWDEENSQFRQSRFKPVGVNTGKELASGGKSGAQWFIRVTEGTPELNLGNGTFLIWPNADTPKRYIWLLTLKLEYEKLAENKPPEKLKLPVVELLIAWDLSRLLISKYDAASGTQS